MAEILYWGYKKGCGPLQDNPTCQNLPMVCQRSGTQCSEDYFSVGQCSLDHVNPANQNEEINGCSVFKERLDCRFQSNPGDRCIDFFQEGTSRNATCGAIACTKRPGNDMIFDVSMKFKDYTVACLAEEAMQEKVIDGTKDKVICPNTLNVCRTGAMCPKDCSNNGRCKMDGTCWCFPDFTGDDCSKINAKPYRMIVLDWKSWTFSIPKAIFLTILSNLIY